MNKPSNSTFSNTRASFARALAPVAPMLALALQLAPRVAAADDADRIAAVAQPADRAVDHSGWSINLTPVLLFPKGEYRFGGGADPEVKYTLDLGVVRLSAGGRVGAYYAKNQFGVTMMPTVRLMVPLGPVEPYASVGMGYGWLPRAGHSDFVTMARAGFVYRFTPRIAVGLEATVERLDHSTFSFPSFGSMMAFDL